jgi:hypothetical protein
MPNKHLALATGAGGSCGRASMPWPGYAFVGGYWQLIEGRRVSHEGYWRAPREERFERSRERFEHYDHFRR